MSGFWKKLGDSLSKAFGEALAPPKNLFPETRVQDEMRKDGWDFQTHVVGGAYMTMPICVYYIQTPDGKCIGSNTSNEADNARYAEAVAATRQKLGITAPKTGAPAARP